MHCPMQTGEGAEAILEYCAGRLAPDRAVLLEGHLEICESCRDLVVAQKALWRALDLWESQPPPPRFDARLYDRLAAEEQFGWVRRVFRSSFPVSSRVALPVAATFLIVIGSLLVQRPAVPDLAAASRAEAMDVEQVERALEDLDMLRQFNPVRVPASKAAGLPAL